MPPQLKTILPLFALFILVFLIIRHFLVPSSFGDKGHYRFNSIQENMDAKLNYAGKASCAECHDDKTAELDSDAHAKLSCEVCHGPALSHVNAPDSIDVFVPEGREHCGLCHSLNPAKNNKIIVQIDLNEHNIDQQCIECHNPHMPWKIKE